jgi:hypothetical protein
VSGAQDFFTRWSRREAEVPRGGAPGEPAIVAEADAVVAASQAAPEILVDEKPPSLDDVAALAPGDEVSRFVAQGVDEAVKRAAVKKLFTDPHFNIMDGLDIYIDDYSKPDPIPAAMLRQMNQSRSLGLFADEEVEPAPEAITASAATTTPAAASDPSPAQDADPPAPAAEAVPQTDDEDPDLQLQPDDAARRPGADEGAGPGGV